MKRIFVDTNILADFALQRSAFAQPAKQLMIAAARKRIVLVTTPMCMGTLLYLLQPDARKNRPAHVAKVKAMCRLFLNIVELVPVSKEHFARAIAGPFTDVEDGVQYEAVMDGKGVDAVCTRDPGDYSRFSAVPVLDANGILSYL